ncbi:MLP-like protein 43 [Morus notabilis]|uniref:MLP-like protein 43 n=1 Tax=Morus notabilis TaxID=981085 RepID=UPI000CED2ABD|nr:MLP-like protein 43 [Morus notabilis]
MSSDVYGKLETDVESKASPKKFHDIFKHRPHHISNHSSDKVHGCEIHEDGKPRVAKEIVEAIDDEKNLITFRVIEGDLLEHFKSFIITVQANPKPEGEGSLLHWTLEYEKHHGEIIDPHTLLQFLSDVSKDLETHLLEYEAEAGTQAVVLEERVMVTGDMPWTRNGIQMVTYESCRISSHGTSGVFKEKVEFDDANKAVILNGFEGDVFNEYKLFKPVYHVVPNPKGRGSIAKLSIEYEKLHEGVPPPDKYVKLMVNISKDLDVHFGKA